MCLISPEVVSAAVTSITPSTWNILGLDSNSPAFGPNRYPVGAQVCSDSGGPVTAQLIWEAGGTTNDDSVIKLRTGTSDTITLDFPVGGGCLDAFYEVEISQNAGSYDQTRRYRITAGGVSTPTPRELKVERLVSQSRNAISDIQFGTTLSSLTSVPNGGSFDLVVGRTYYIKMVGYTATQGYEQLESFINFPNTIFRILSVSTTYSADTSPLVSSPNDKLYADACGWDNDPNSPSYLSCWLDGKAGGSVAVTYQVEILNVSSSRESLNSLIHDFSGSSFHYNADYSTSARFANIVNPSDLTISKSFAPTPIAAGGTSALTVAISNATYGTIDGLEFTDIFPTSPGAMKVAATPAASTTCGGTLTDNGGGALGANDTGIKLTGGSVPGLSTCLVKVNVTTDTLEGSYLNTTGSLQVRDPVTSQVTDTGKIASATLVVDNNAFPLPAPPSSCSTRTEMVRWNMNNGTGTPPTYSSKHADVNGTLTVASYVGSGTPSIDTGDPGAGNYSWIATNGWPVASGYYGPNGTPYFQFAVDTSRFGNVQVHYDYILKGNQDWGGSNYIYIDTSADGVNWTTVNTTTTATKGSWQTNQVQTAATTSSTITYFRFRFAGAASNKTPVAGLDNVWFDGCAVVPVDPPEITKAFSPDIVAQGDTSILTFTITNPNVTPSYALSGVTVTDTFPAGMTVAAPLTTSNTCGGSLVDDSGGALAAGATGIRLTSGSLAAPVGVPTTCTFSVEVQAGSVGTYDNTSRAVAATESGANTGASGVAAAALKVLAPPTIAKQFAPDPIFTSAFGGAATLTFLLANPNAADAISGVGFADTYPAGLVNTNPLVTATTCGGAITALAGGNSVSFSGGTITAGNDCTVSINVQAIAAGSYSNTSGNVYHTLNGYTGNGNTATDSLQVETATPAIALLKQVGPTDTGPWSSYLAVVPGGAVYYKFTVENLGDVALSSVNVTDPAAWVNLASCSWSDGDGTPLTPPFNLPVAGASNAHLASCVTATPATAVVGTHPNTATATGSFGGSPYTDTSTATYATSSLTLTKAATQAYFLAAGNVLNYSYTVANSGALLLGPLTITVTDNKISSVSCPAVTTVGDNDLDFDPGETLVCTATYTVTASDVSAKQIVNVARANISGVNIGSLNTPTATETVPLGPDLTAAKTNNVGGNAYTSTPFTWTVTVGNSSVAGLAAAFANGQALLVDNLPAAGATYGPPTATTAGGTTGTITCGIAANTLTCTASGPVNIPPGGAFSVAVPTTPTAAGPLANPTGGGLCRADPNTLLAEMSEGNNDCADTVTVVTPALALLKSADRAYFATVGEVISYTYQVRNTGAAPLAGPATVTDDKSANESCPADVTGAILFASGLPGNGDNILDPGEEVTCTATYTVAAADVTAGKVTNIATATVGVATSPQATVTVLLGAADVTMVKSSANLGPSGYALPGETVRYTLVITNAAGSPTLDANSLVVIDQIPANTALVTTEPVVSIVNNPATTGLTLSYGGLTDTTDQVEFSTDGVNFNYIPTGIGGVDESVTHIRYRPTGSMNGNASFTATFKVRIQ